MTILGKSNSLGGNIQSYPPGKILFDGNNGTTANIDFKRGVYYIRGQGAGGCGGNCGYHYTGSGGGSSAGFEGYIYLNRHIGIKKCYSGIVIQGSASEATYITDLLTLGGGGQGGSNNGLAGPAGIISISSIVQVISATKNSNGYQGEASVGPPRCGGANSVLTNTGGGPLGASPQALRHATAPGAGGAGGIQFDEAGGFGKYGELTIRYIKSKP